MYYNPKRERWGRVEILNAFPTRKKIAQQKHPLSATPSVDSENVKIAKTGSGEGLKY